MTTKELVDHLMDHHGNIYHAAQLFTPESDLESVHRIAHRRLYANGMPGKKRSRGGWGWSGTKPDLTGTKHNLST